MDHIWLIVLLLALSVAQPLSLKLASRALPHATSPLYMSLWTLLGLIICIPFFGHLAADLTLGPVLVALIMFKGMLLWWAFRDTLHLTEYSLSAQSYILPSALGLTAIFNAFLGENLSTPQWAATIGLCALGIAFSLRGHVQDLTSSGKFLYARLIALVVVMATIDHVILSQTNWYIVLWISNLVILALALFYGAKPKSWVRILTHKYALLAGILFAARELIKFYLMVSIIPVSVMVGILSVSIPIVLILSALIWGERSWQEQILWGGFSCVFMILLLI